MQLISEPNSNLKLPSLFAMVFLTNKLFFNKSVNLNLVTLSELFVCPVQDSKKLSASPDGVITNENILRDYIASLEAKEDAKKDLNNSSMIANQVWVPSFVNRHRH